jgi:hypothetical protein
MDAYKEIDVEINVEKTKYMFTGMLFKIGT